MADGDMEFPYETSKTGIWTKILAVALLFAAAGFFLAQGGDWSLLEGPSRAASPVQNYGVNLILAFGFGIFGFVALMSVLRPRTEGPRAVVVSQEAIDAPDQGRMGRPQRLRFADFVHMEKLSIDGVWEFNIVGRDQRIRIPKTALAQAEDFDALIDCLQIRAPHCPMKTTVRIDPPSLSS